MLKMTLLLVSVFICLLVVVLVVTQSRIGQQNIVDNTAVVSESPDAETLVLLLHAFTKSGDSMNAVKAVVQEHYKLSGVDFIQPDMPLGTLSVASNTDIIAELVDAIDEAWNKRLSEGRAYKRIVLVGHSFGSLLARKLYVVVNGEPDEIDFETELYRSFGVDVVSEDAERRGKKTGVNSEFYRPWSKSVERIVLFAGMNRGWSISHHMSIPRAISHQLGVGLAYIIEIFSGHAPNIMSIRRGAPFITQLRLQWLAMERMLSGEGAGNANDTGKAALTIQMLGSVDDLVSPEDNMDLVTGAHFVYLDVPYSGHSTVINLLDKENPDQAAARRCVFQEALSMPADTKTSDDSFYSKLEPDPTVTDVIFIVHGIRDLGHWTAKIGRKVFDLSKEINESEESKEINIATETSSYGYFPMLSFLIPGARQEKVHWLMDRYTEAKARYPEASFHYIGHSHGTYLLAKALEDYRSVNFKHVVFAGSVVRQKYEWDKYLASGRIKKVQNFVATADWVVGIFPKAFQSLRLQDLGSAGHDGFEKAHNTDNVFQPKKFVIGGHGAALQEDMWKLIANFILKGEYQDPPDGLVNESQSLWVVVPSYVAPVILIGIVLLACWGGIYLLGLSPQKVQEWKKTLLVLGYLGAIWLVITKV